MPARQPRPQPVHTDLVRLMLLARGLERRARQAHLGPRSRASAARGRGSEAFAVGAASALGPQDRLFASDRYLAAHLTRGLAPEDFLVRCLGGTTPRTTDDTVGFASPGGELVDLAAGAALALQLRESNGVALTLVPGEAYRGGQCDQALRAARSRGLPLVMVIEGSVEPPADVESRVVQAHKVEIIASAVRGAVRSVRNGDAPVVVICDDSRSPDESALGDGDSRDPIRRELHRLACNAATRELIVPLRDEVSVRVRAAEKRARLVHTRSNFA